MFDGPTEINKRQWIWVLFLVFSGLMGFVVCCCCCFDTGWKVLAYREKDLSILKLMNSNDLWVYARGYKEKGLICWLPTVCQLKIEASHIFYYFLLKLIPSEGAEGKEKQMRINDQRHRQTTRRKWWCGGNQERRKCWEWGSGLQVRNYCSS